MKMMALNSVIPNVFPGINKLFQNPDQCKHGRIVKMSAVTTKEGDYVPIVKMCGITSSQDASDAAKLGASYVGMILWPKSKRSVSLSLAREIAAAAREQGAEPVGVFVDEDACTIEKACEEAGIDIAQLHGAGSRAALASLSAALQVIYVLHADKHGVIKSETETACGHALEWILVDGLQGGSGEPFDWTNFQPPTTVAGERGWFLAGGLNPSNVASALTLIKPFGVDVSSGIAGEDGIRKDFSRMRSFMQAVKL